MNNKCNNHKKLYNFYDLEIKVDYYNENGSFDFFFRKHTFY
ncbi:hypothetical protein [Dethiothermospora halolimnae]